MARIALIVFIVALTIYAFIDAAKMESSRMPARLSKPVWLLAILIVPVLGPVMWLYFRYQHILSSSNPVSPSDLANKMRNSRKPKGPVAPDDDPEFLARLEARNRRRAYEQRKREEEGLDPEELDEDELANDDEENDDEGGLYGRR